MDKCIMSGGLLNMLDDGLMEQWLRSEHIKYVLRWLVPDQANPALAAVCCGTDDPIIVSQCIPGGNQ